jgi:hypothetical protein
VLLACSASRAGAQAALGLGEDATLPPRGALRVGVGSSWTHYDQRFGPTGRPQSLAAAWNIDSIGAKQFPVLSELQSGLRALTGLPQLTVSLGSLGVSQSVLASTVPVALEVGLTRRLAFGALIPIVHTRSTVGTSINPTGREANVAINPAVAGNSTLKASALSRNTLIYNELGSARTQLTSALARCRASPTSSALCPSIVANGQTLIDAAARAQAQIASVYGVTNGGAGLPFIPIAGSPTQLAVEGQVAALAAAFGAYSAAGVQRPTAPGPLGAPAAIGRAELDTLVSSNEFGVGASPLTSVDRSHVGDIEVSGKVLLFDSFGAPGASRFAPRGVNARAALTGVVRLPTGQRESANDFLDVGTGEAQTDIELHAATDLVVGRQFWATIVGRYTHQLPDRPMLRIATATETFVPEARLATVQRRLGDYFELEATPRYGVGDYFGFGLQYTYRNKAADRYSGGVTDSTGAVLRASLLDAGTAYSEHRVGVGFTYSTLAAATRLRRRLPLEITYRHVQTVSARGGYVPKAFTDEIRLRVYRRLWGR